MVITSKHILHSPTYECCEDCRSDNIIIDERRGIVVCADCGLVLNNKIYSDLQVDYSHLDGPKYRTPKTGKTSPTLKHALKVECWKDTYERKGYLNAIIAKLKVKYDVPPLIFESVRQIANKLYDGRYTIHNLEGFCNACYYHVCRFNHFPILFRDHLNNQEFRNMTREYKFIQKYIGKVEILKPSHLISLLQNTFNYPQEVWTKCALILNQIEKKGKTYLSGKTPAGITAGVFYLVVKHRHLHTGERKISQRDIALALNITEVTLRKRAEELMNPIIKKNLI